MELRVGELRVGRGRADAPCGNSCSRREADAHGARKPTSAIPCASERHWVWTWASEFLAAEGMAHLWEPRAGLIPKGEIPVADEAMDWQFLRRFSAPPNLAAVGTRDRRLCQSPATGKGNARRRTCAAGLEQSAHDLALLQKELGCETRQNRLGFRGGSGCPLALWENIAANGTGNLPRRGLDVAASSLVVSTRI